MAAAPSKSTGFTKGPARGAYTIYTILSTIITLPAYCAVFAVPSLRPHPGWTFFQSFSNHLTRIAFEYWAVTQCRTPPITAVGPGLGDFIRLEPSPAELYKGVRALDTSSIKPSPLGAVWVPAMLSKGDDLEPNQYTCLHFHGGAYVLLSCGDPNVQHGPRALAEALGGPILLPDYRKASNPGGRFPAALQDAITAYKSLLDLSVPSSQILLSGDSAGGNLVLALLRFIHDSQKLQASDGENRLTLPPPAGAALWSPWTDMSDVNVATHPNAQSDYLTHAILSWGVCELVPANMSPHSPYLSPGLHPFPTATPLFVHSGAAEVFSSQHHTFVDAFRSVPGNRVELREAKGAFHDVSAGGDNMGFGQEQKDACRAAVRFLCRP